MAACPVCGYSEVKAETRNRDAQFVDCPVCGQFALLGMLVAGVDFSLKPGSLESAVLSHAIRKMQPKHVQSIHERPTFVLDEINQIIKDARLPSPAEQADNFVVWLGDNLDGAGANIPVTYDRFKAIVGAKTGEGVAFVVRTLLDKGLIDCQGQTSHQLRGLPAASLTLSMDGWQRYETLMRGASDSRKAFMAMKFGDANLDAVFRDCFKPAVTQSGFNLVRIDENPQAGLIDDRLRVEIRSSRFVIADLTHGNLGAYWEAGYAEGLGKPVIYTCEKSIFDKEKTHFDTNHHLTVPWDQTKLADAAQRLKDTIRATLPADARLND